MRSTAREKATMRDRDESAALARAAMREIGTAASARLVNRTHRVVRERAKVIKARKSRVRSLMVPLILCSALLILTALAAWSGFYETESQTDLVARAATDANNHFLVALLWFVPVSIALMVTLWVRRSRASADDEAR